MEGCRQGFSGKTQSQSERQKKILNMLNIQTPAPYSFFKDLGCHRNPILGGISLMLRLRIGQKWQKNTSEYVAQEYSKSYLENLNEDLHKWTPMAFWKDNIC